MELVVIIPYLVQLHQQVAVTAHNIFRLLLMMVALVAAVVVVVVREAQMAQREQVLQTKVTLEAQRMGLMVL
jgi:hypothetical protein